MGVQHHEVIIVGGGMVGATLAALLGQAGISVAVLDGAEPAPWSADSLPDLRVSSVNAASLQVIEGAGAWPGITSRRHCPFRRLRVWDVSGRGETAFSADDIGADVLGHFVENTITRLAVWERLAQLPSVTRLCPALPEGVEPRARGALTVRLRDGRRLSCRLLVGADGARSAVRSLLRIGVETHDYRQHAMITNVVTRLPQQDVTWQCFTPDGPVAFLPLQGPHASLVWYDRPDVVRRRLALSNPVLHQHIEAAFPSDLGGIERIIATGSFPIRRVHAQRYRAYRSVLIGDAAHVIHPLAGQGLNLGLQDVACLAERLIDACQRGEDPGATALLAGYEARRRPANLAMMSAMSLFHRVFTSDVDMLRQVGAFGLGLADRLGPIKQMAMRHAMGLTPVAGGGWSMAGR